MGQPQLNKMRRCRIFKHLPNPLVASTGIEPVSGASEALILSIVLRGRLNLFY